MSRDSVNPRKSDSVELYENSHIKCIEIDVGSTSNWNTSGNFFKKLRCRCPLLEFRNDALSLLCVGEVIKHKQRGLVFISVTKGSCEKVAREHHFWVVQRSWTGVIHLGWPQPSEVPLWGNGDIMILLGLNPQVGKRLWGTRGPHSLC